MANKQATTNKSGALLLMAIVYTVLQTVGVVFTVMDGIFDLSWIIQSALMAVLCFVLYFAYRSHTKNVMKPLLGAVLMLLLTYEITSGGLYLQSIPAVKALFQVRLAGALFATAQILLLFVVAGINVMHYVINASHHSNPGKVRCNQLLCDAFIVLLLVQVGCFLFMCPTPVSFVGNGLATLSDVFAMAIVIRIEKSLDDFRIVREEKAAEAEAAAETEAETEK